MVRLGIDLGTSNSAAAICRDNKETIIVSPEALSDGVNVYPSYVAFDDNGNFMVAGLHAKERYRDGATDFVVRHFKRLIGRNYDYVAGHIASKTRYFGEFEGRIEKGPEGEVLICVGPKRYSVVDITAFLLRKIKEDAEVLAEKRWGESIEGVTISLPAGFEEGQRKATDAAAIAAGFPRIKVIEEPTAAAIEKGIEGTHGNIMVVDIGAGTTDVVIGSIAEKQEEQTVLAMTERDCDDVLGGLDMDYLILDYLLENDDSQPPLRDIYPGLDMGEKNRLMAAIETAKINASLYGLDHISVALSIPGKKKKLFSFSLDELTLDGIVSPLFEGRKSDGLLKGIFPLVESTLMKIAENDPAKVRREIQKIDKLILVGGPCRMRSVHKELIKLFRENTAVCKDLEKIDPLDNFFMEGVAKGAARTAKGNTTLKDTISTFHWEKGRTPILPAGVPYDRDEGVSRSGRVSVGEGDNSIYIIIEKEKEPLRNWTMRRHLVKVPEEGDLKLTICWGEGGTESGRTVIEGAGLRGAIQFPPSSHTTTLGKSLNDAFKEYLQTAKNLRNQVQNIRDTPTRDLLRKKLIRGISDAMEIRAPGFKKRLNNDATAAITELSSYLLDGLPVPDWIERECTKRLSISEEDLEKCQAIDPETAFTLTDAHIREAFARGYFAPRDGKWAPEVGIPDRAIKVLRVIFDLINDISVPIDHLFGVADMVLAVGRGHAANSPDVRLYVQQLEEELTQTKKRTGDRVRGYEVAMALGSLADCLRNSGSIEEELYRIVKVMVHLFDPRNQ